MSPTDDGPRTAGKTALNASAADVSQHGRLWVISGSEMADRPKRFKKHSQMIGVSNRPRAIFSWRCSHQNAMTKANARHPPPVYQSLEISLGETARLRFRTNYGRARSIRPHAHRYLRQKCVLGIHDFCFMYLAQIGIQIVCHRNYGKGWKQGTTAKGEK